MTSTPDDNYIICGYAFGALDDGAYEEGLYLLKMSSDGTKIWSQTYHGGGGSLYDHRPSFVRSTSDNGFILGGNLDNDMFLIKTNSTGQKIWSRTYDGATNINSIELTDEGGYILTGNEGGLRIIGTDADGEVLWNNFYDDDSFGHRIIANDNGEYLVYGRTNVSSDINLRKIDSSGETIWVTNFDGSAYDKVLDAIIPSEGTGYLLCGTSNRSNDDALDVLVMKIDENGEELWSQTYNGEDNAIGNSITPTQDGNYLICGFDGNVDHETSNILLIKIDENGNKLWSHTYGGEHTDVGNDILETQKNEIIICSTSQTPPSFENDWPTDSELVIVKTDSEGELILP